MQSLAQKNAKYLENLESTLKKINCGLIMKQDSTGSSSVDFFELVLVGLVPYIDPIPEFVHVPSPLAAARDLFMNASKNFVPTCFDAELVALCYLRELAAKKAVLTPQLLVTAIALVERASKLDGISTTVLRYFCRLGEGTLGEKLLWLVVSRTCRLTMQSSVSSFIRREAQSRGKSIYSQKILDLLRLADDNSS